MTWAHPGFLPALLGVPMVALLLVWAWRRRRDALARIAAIEALAALLPVGVTRRRLWQSVLVVVATTSLLVAGAGPRLGFDWQQRKMQGVAIMAILDVSRSMDAADVSPSRLERARRELLDLSGLLRGDRVGLVLFAAGAWTRIPLTADYATFAWAVRDSTSDTIRAQGSALSGAVDAATKALSRAPGSGKAILLVSDGEFHEDAASIEAAVKRAAEAGVHIYALGVGTPEGAPIPVAEGGFKKDERGAVVLSKLGEAALKGVAEATGGAYVRAVTSDEDVRALYEDEIRGKLEAAESGVRRDRVWRERFQWPLAIGLFALVLRSGFDIGRRFLPLLLLGVPLAARAGAAEEGMAAFRGGKWEVAAQQLGQARAESPGDPGVTSALATALYRSGRFRESEQMFRTAASETEDPARQGIAWYNAGNAAYADGRLDDAQAWFSEAAKRAPEFEPAKKNGEATAREIAARMQPKPPEEQQGEDNQPQDQQGEPQDQQGEPQQGEPQDQQGEQQQGEPQDQPGEPQDQQGQPGQPEPGEEEPQPGEEPGVPQAVDPGEEPATEETAGGQDSGTSPAPGDMSAEQAARLVDAVPDGKPRVRVGGRSAGEDW